MTSREMILMTGLYLAAFVAVAYFARAQPLRIAGAAAGGAVLGVVALLAVALGEAQGLWRVPNAGSSYFQLLFRLGFSVSCAPVYLITWRVARLLGRTDGERVQIIRSSTGELHLAYASILVTNWPWRGKPIQ